MDTASSDLAVLFADVSGSTRLYETLGDVRALATIERCLALVKAACDGNAGRVIKTIGDEAMAVFPTADNAAQAAAEMQARVTAEPAIAAERLTIRVGFHFGPALRTDGDVFGDSVNVAARLVGVAHGAQVITSAATVSALSPWLRMRTRELTALTVKGKLRDLSVFELIWQDSADDLTTLSTRVIAPVAELSVRHGAVEIVLGERRATVTLGRDAQNDIVIADANGGWTLQDAIVRADGDATIKTRALDLVRNYTWPPQVTGRALRNRFVATWHEREGELAVPETQAREFKRYVEARESGDAENTGIFVGEAAGLINDVRPAGDIVSGIVEDAERLLKLGT